jgi:phage gp45-like
MQIDAPTIKTITPNGSYGGNVNVNSTPPKTSTTDTTSSGGKTSKPKEVKKEDIVDRYKEQND